MNIVILGPPGAGKGTQAERLAQEYNLHKVSTGDLVRAEISGQTELGLQIQSIVESGEFPDDALITRLLKKSLSSKSDGRGFIFDGYPRTFAQAEMLEKILEEMSVSLDFVISLSVQEDILVQRISGRLTCRGCGATYHKEFSPPKTTNICDQCGGVDLKTRADDMEEAVRTRFKVYSEKTKPVIDYYATRGVLKTIDGTQGIETVATEIDSLIASAA